MNAISRWLATVGMLVAGPAFILNVIAHDGRMPGPDEVDRTDGAFSLMFMAGVALIVAALIIVRPSPLGRRGRWLLYVEAVMVVLAATWAAFIVVDPANSDAGRNVLLHAGDASWPLHQALMLAVGILAARSKLWPSPGRWMLFGPFVGVATLLVAAALDVDMLAATAIGGGWVMAAAGVIAVTACEESNETRRAACVVSA